MTDHVKIYAIAVAENVITISAALAGAYFISPWCLLILANLNTWKYKK